ncbi:30S ribosomal protein S27ae [Candidatus Woesearchaeota archaeon]|nr:30S ribosomal protein S27ae [Candidatus Woesearchaeota archaeon]
MAKKKKKKKTSSKKYKMYEASGSELKRKNKFCPKCGTGVFMAQHKDRMTCGKCSYTEFTGKEK